MTDNLVTFPPMNEPVPITSPITPQAMLGMAVARGDTELAAKLMDLVERWEARTAKRAFDNAIATADFPVIIKRKKMDAGSGRTSYMYEDLAAIAEAIGDELTANGLSYRFRTNATDKSISVTCIVSHRDGHSEETTLSAPAESSGSKNSIQALGSALTYLQRYSLKAALGLAAAVDDDAKKLDKDPPITEEQLQDLNAICVNVAANVDLLCKVLGVDVLANLPTSKYAEAVYQLSRKLKLTKKDGAS